MPDPNFQLLEEAGTKLAPFLYEIVFVGGVTLGLLITDKAAAPIRSTDDVDVIAEILTYLDYIALSKEVLGYTNPWYESALQHAVPFVLPSGQPIRVITAPYFLGTKIEAFRGRGQMDFPASHDLEDFVAVIDGRGTILKEIADSSSDVREYLAQRVSDHPWLCGRRIRPRFTDTVCAGRNTPARAFTRVTTLV